MYTYVCIMKMRSKGWSAWETTMLCNLIEEKQVLEKINGKGQRNHLVFAELEKEFQQRGIEYNWEQIRNKWKNLKSQYYKQLRMVESGDEGATHPHFEQLNKLLQRTPKSPAVVKGGIDSFQVGPGVATYVFKIEESDWMVSVDSLDKTSEISLVLDDAFSVPSQESTKLVSASSNESENSCPRTSQEPASPNAVALFEPSSASSEQSRVLINPNDGPSLEAAPVNPKASQKPADANHNARPFLELAPVNPKAVPYQKTADANPNAGQFPELAPANPKAVPSQVLCNSTAVSCVKVNNPLVGQSQVLINSLQPTQVPTNPVVGKSQASTNPNTVTSLEPFNPANGKAFVIPNVWPSIEPANTTLEPSQISSNSLPEQPSTSSKTLNPTSDVGEKSAEMGGTSSEEEVAQHPIKRRKQMGRKTRSKTARYDQSLLHLVSVFQAESEKDRRSRHEIADQMAKVLTESISRLIQFHTQPPTSGT